MLRVLTVFCLFVVSCLPLLAQIPGMHYCGQAEARERKMTAHPELEQYSRDAHQFLEEFTRSYEQNRGGDGDVYIIPVVFHVIHNNGPENISDDQILEGLQILNRDFRKLNEDISQVVDEFASITADIGIEFRLASIDPNGNCTRGINRIESELTYLGNEEMKTLIYWPRSDYLNVWICADAAGSAGYTYMPGDVSNIWDAGSDGIVIRANYVGSTGTSSISKSRTLTHEAGHWLNLYHTWGMNNTPELESNCGTDDLVSDTPNTIGYYSCDLDGGSCGNSIDNVQNYMEYSYCSKMFTLGQRSRMRAAIVSPVAQRNQLITQSNLISTGVINPAICFAGFSADQMTGCTGVEIHFSDESYHGVTSWIWDFGDGTIISGSDPLIYKDPVHVYTEPGIYSVKLTVSNTQGSLFSLQNNLIRIFAPGEIDPPFIEGFESSWPAEKWLLENEDEGYTWEVTPAAFYSGSKGLKLRNFYNSITDNPDALISATIDMTGMDTILVSYKWAYASKLDETDDRLRVSVSSDCGEHWSLKRNRRGLTNLPTAPATNSTFTPTGQNQWSGETIEIDEAEMMSDLFRVKFEFIGKGGNNIYLDDINIIGIDDGMSVARMTQEFFFHLYPNPAEEDMVLELKTLHNGHLKVSLFNTLGQLCEVICDKETTTQEDRLFIPAQAPGVYLLSIEQNGSRITGRVVFR